MITLVSGRGPNPSMVSMPSRLSLSSGRPSTTTPAIGDYFLSLLGLVLLGYALDGKGFASLGVPPLFIGEVTLLAGLAALAFTKGWLAILETPQIVLMLLLVIWCLARTVPFIEEDGFDSVRDAAVYYYAAFALIVAALLAGAPPRLPRLLARYRIFVRIFLLLIPAVFVAAHFFAGSLPRWPWEHGAPVIHLKEGDVLVHLGGILAFWVSGFGAGSLLWMLMLAADVALMGVIDRAGLLSFFAVLGVCLAHRPRHLVAWRLVTVIVLSVVMLWASEIRLEVPGGKGRELSFHQIWENVTSMGSDTGKANMDSTKEWRLDWWKEIVSYTIHGPYFWTGKGFGVNLATDDGFDLDRDHTLRSPHSVHLSFLARAGVPGLALWAACQLSWGAGIFNAYWRSRRHGDQRWEGLFLFLFCYWMAFLINSSFDVFIEGPMGGIWFWTLYGAGAGALVLYRREPQCLYLA